MDFPAASVVTPTSSPFSSPQKMPDRPLKKPRSTVVFEQAGAAVAVQLFPVPGPGHVLGDGFELSP